MLRFIFFILIFEILTFTVIAQNDFINSTRIKRQQQYVCGRSKKASGLIINGHGVERGDYPWVVTFQNNSITSGLFCGGTLISYRHVLSAAHCFHDKHQSIVEDINRVVVFIGVHDLDDPFENGRITSSVKSLYIHPDWKPFEKNYDADIAILEINSNLSPESNEFIQPICLWNLKEELEENFGTIVGFGLNENYDVTNKPKYLKVPIIHNEKCYLHNPDLAKFSSLRTFCAGSANGSVPCSGDAGSGLFINHDHTFYLRGIVAAGLVKNGDCDVNSYNLYTNVLKFKNWINDIVSTATTIRPLPNTNNKKTSECGVRTVGRGTIIGGSTFEHGDYPWMAVLLNDVNNENTFQYFCGGVIISNKRILTAAHCLDNHERKLLERNILVSIGGHDLEAKYEIGRIIYPVSDMQIYPKWNPRTESFDADIAFLNLENKIDFNRYIQQICLINPLWENSLPNEGVILGYGKSEHPTRIHETIPRELKINIVLNEACWLHEPKLLTLSSERTFCAGTLNGAGACRGDSGHGLFVKIGNVFFLRGLVSASLLTDDGICDVNKYSVFTNVLRFTDWFNR